MWTVTRQIQWPDGDHMVEISEGGLDYTNPDALAAQYPGEFEEFVDPRDALDAAIEIARAWRKDTRKKISIGHGATGGMTMPFSPSTIKDLKAWAKKAAENLPRCDKCGEIIKGDPFTLWDYEDVQFCSESCAELYWDEQHKYEAVAYIQDGLDISEKRAEGVLEELWYSGKIDSWDDFWKLPDAAIKQAAIEAGVK